jgi:hypothetical protein
VGFIYSLLGEAMMEGEQGVLSVTMNLEENATKGWIF